MNNYRLKFMRKNERKMLLSLKIENTTSKDSFTHQFENGCESKTEQLAYMQRDFEQQVEQIKNEEKRPTFDLYLDGHAGYATPSEPRLDEFISSTRQQTSDLELMATYIEPLVKITKT